MRAFAILAGLCVFAAAPAFAAVAIPISHPAMRGGGHGGHYGNHGHRGPHGGPGALFYDPFGPPAPTVLPAPEAALAPAFFGVAPFPVLPPPAPVCSAGWPQERGAGPKIIYLGATPKARTPKVIYGTE